MNWHLHPARPQDVLNTSAAAHKLARTKAPFAVCALVKSLNTFTMGSDFHNASFVVDS